MVCLKHYLTTEKIIAFLLLSSSFQGCWDKLKDTGMVSYFHKLPQEIYDDYLKKIRHMSFTRREIDIIACLLSGRTAKTIAPLLSIAPRTVETHTRNIAVKLNQNSREGIRDFIEKSGMLSIIGDYYISLLIQCAFESRLGAIAALNDQEHLTCLIIYRQQQYQKSNPPLISQMEAHLTRVGMRYIAEVHENLYDIFYLNHPEKYQGINYRIGVVDESFLTECQYYANQKAVTVHSSKQKASAAKSVFFLLPTSTETSQIPREISDLDYITYGPQKNYYTLFFEIIKKLIPHMDLNSIIESFEKEQENIVGSYRKAPTQNSQPEKQSDLTSEENENNKFFKTFLALFSPKKLKWFLGGIGILSLVSILGLFIMLRQPTSYIETPFSKHDLSTQNLLNRPLLITEISKKLEGTDGIQTVALMGIGGSGKTTLARQYAHSQKHSIVEEINAENKNSLVNSFENLAYRLCKTEEDKRALIGIKEIRNLAERQEKIIQMVKNQLKSCQNWLLIYDNVEDLTDNKQYFPSDTNDWGKGKVIITTQDMHIQNNSYVKSTLQIGELEPDEKLSLFMAIMPLKGKETINSEQQKSARKFLEKIPSFPLDIVVAAYYMRATNTDYEKYRRYLVDYDQSFSEIQKNILKEANNYAKTRYHIIILPLDKLISVDKNFAGLLLLVNFLDSKNIPRALLDSYKGRIAVDNFVYHLKKYSLLIDETSENTGSTTVLSIHQSTQEVARSYLGKKLNITQDPHLLKETATALGNYIEDCIDKEDYASSAILLNHTEAFLSRNPFIDDAIRRSLEPQLGGIYHYLGNYKRSKEFLEASLSEANQNENKDYLQRAKTLIYLGNTYRSLRDYEKAKELLEESLTIYKKHFPENYADIARASAYLGNLYRKQENYERAKNLLQESLALYQRELPKNYTGIARASAYLGSVYKKLSMLEKAKTLLENSLAIYEKNLPENHAGICWVLTLLGNVYKDLGDLNQAKDLLLRSLSTYQKYLPENYIRASWTLKQLGALYKTLGNYQESRKCFEKVLMSYQKHYGNNHVETARVLQNLGDVYSLEGDLDKAESYIKQSLEITKRYKSSEKHESLELLAEIYFKKFTKAKEQGDMQKAANLKQQTTSCFKEALALSVTASHNSTDASSAQRIKDKLKKIQEENL